MACRCGKTGPLHRTPQAPSKTSLGARLRTRRLAKSHPRSAVQSRPSLSRTRPHPMSEFSSRQSSPIAPQCPRKSVQYPPAFIWALTLPFGFYLSPGDIQPHPTPRWTPSVVAWPMAEAANPCPLFSFPGLTSANPPPFGAKHRLEAHINRLLQQRVKAYFPIVA